MFFFQKKCFMHLTCRNFCNQIPLVLLFFCQSLRARGMLRMHATDLHLSNTIHFQKKLNMCKNETLKHSMVKMSNTMIPDLYCTLGAILYYNDQTCYTLLYDTGHLKQKHISSYPLHFSYSVSTTGLLCYILVLDNSI